MTNIKNEYKITRDLIKKWSREDQFGTAFGIVIFSLYVFTGLIGVTMICLMFKFGGDALNWYLSFFLVLFSAFRLTFVPYHAWTSKYKMMSKTYGVPEWIRSTEFTDDEIIISDHTSVTKFKYDNLKSVKEKGNEVRILFNNRLLIVVYKDAFKKGSWDECRKLLEEKMPKNVK